MKITLAKHSGFCFGVKRALEIALETAGRTNKAYIKGDLVHNNEVSRMIEEKGIKKIHSLKEVPQGSILIIKAHGEPLRTYKECARRKLKIIDATCPMVKEIHRKAQDLEQKGYQVVIIGDRTHKETTAIKGNIKNGLVIEKPGEVAGCSDKLSKKIGVVCQSTQNRENVSRIVYALSKYAQELLFLNTICQPTRLRQLEIEHLAGTCKATLIVGAKHSANTKRLYQVAKKVNRNTFWIDSPDKIKSSLRNRFSSLGIIGGASTPQETLEEVYRRLR